MGFPATCLKGIRSGSATYPHRVSRVPATLLKVPVVYLQTTRSMFWWVPAPCFRDPCSVVEGSSQRVAGNPRRVFSRVLGACLEGVRNMFPWIPAPFLRLFETGCSIGRGTSDFRYGCDWFSELQAAVFRVVRASIFKKRTGYSEKAGRFRRVSAVGPRSQKK